MPCSPVSTGLWDGWCQWLHVLGGFACSSSILSLLNLPYGFVAGIPQISLSGLHSLDTCQALGRVLILVKCVLCLYSYL